MSSQLTRIRLLLILLVLMIVTSLFCQLGVQGDSAPPPLQAPSTLGLVVPHHLVAQEAIASIFTDIQSFEPSAVVILSPAHFKPVNNPIITTSQSLGLQGGTYPVHKATASLIKSGLAVDEPQRFKTEHGVNNLLPFVKEYFGNVPVIPICLARNVTARDLDTLHNLIKTALVKENVLWIASIDFSHYLPASVANQRDLETQNWIATKNYDAIATSTNDHLDAPSVLILWLKAFSSPKLIWHSNSAVITNTGFNAEGTSYHIYKATD